MQKALSAWAQLRISQMGNEKPLPGAKVEAKVETFTMSRAVGRAIATLGSMEVLVALNEGPRRWKDLKRQTGLLDMTLNRALKALVAARLVVAREASAERKGIDTYEKTPSGRSIHKILMDLEKEGVKQAAEEAADQPG